MSTPGDQPAPDPRTGSQPGADPAGQPEPAAVGRPDFAPAGADRAATGSPEPTVALPAGTTVQPVAAPPPTRRKPRSRAVMIAVIAVLGVLAVLIAGDRVADAVAENALATRLQTELATPAKPEVAIGGFPFVTQVLSGSFGSVRIQAADATVQDGSKAVRIATLDATVTDVTATERYANIVAGAGTATALVDWASVSEVVGQRLSYVADDRIRLDFSVPLGRLAIDGYVTGRPELNAADQTITIADPEVNVGQVDVPQVIVDAVSRAVLRPFPIEGLPYDIALTGLVVQPDGLLLTATGADIPLRGK